jgi:mono/diheme cytochrome c family protein
MKKRRTYSAGMLALLGALSNGADAAAAAPTFNRDVAPIFYKNCVRCHRAGEIAASQPLLPYAAAKALARAIKEQVATRRMPPWPADPTHSLKFRNDAQLTQAELDTVVAWVDAGTPQGNAADLQPEPPAASGWQHPQGLKPDAVLRLPEVALAAHGEIPYVLQRVKVPLPKDAWIVAMQVRPGNNALVHHMGITEVSVADGVSPEDLDALAKVGGEIGIGGDVLANMQPAVADPRNPGTYDMLGVYTPGTTFEMYDHDSARLLKAGSNLYINFNIHYTTTGRPQKNHSELALWFRPDAPKHQLFRAPAGVGTLIANGRQLLTDDPGTKAEGTDVAIPPIPPYAGNYELIGLTAYTSPMTIYQLQPHAHMRGKDFTYSIVYPDGHEVTVLSVPKYDFHWQLAYDLDTPLTVPAGGKLVVTAHYDNSSKNPHLTEAGVDPTNCGPDKQAYFRRQNQSWHEMFSPLLQYSMDGDGRGNVPLVETVGCLSPSAGRTWTLMRASVPRPVNTPSTAASELRTLGTVAASGAAAGNQRYELLGVGMFSPQRESAHRVAVKGLLIKGPEGDRLNVTSLQPVRGECGAP